VYPQGFFREGTAPVGNEISDWDRAIWVRVQFSLTSFKLCVYYLGDIKRNMREEGVILAGTGKIQGIIISKTSNTRRRSR